MNMQRRLQKADGFIIGEPVYYGGPQLHRHRCLWTDFFTAMALNLHLSLPQLIASCRRGGLTAAMDRMNKYFTIAQMPIVSSNYWNGVHGNVPEEVLQVS